MLKCKQVAVFSGKTNPVTSGRKLLNTLEYRFLGRISDLEDSIHLEKMRDMFAQNVVSDCVSQYLHHPVFMTSKEERLSFRIHHFMAFLDDYYRPHPDRDSEKVSIKLRFLKDVVCLTKDWKPLSFPALSSLGLCFGLRSRGRVLDTSSNKSQAVVTIGDKRIVADNRYFLGKGVYGSVKTGTVYSGEKAESVAIKRIRISENRLPSSRDLRMFAIAIQEAVLPSILGTHPHIMPVHDFYFYQDGKKPKAPKTQIRGEGFDLKVALVMPRARYNGQRVLSMTVPFNTVNAGVKVLLDAAKGLAHMESHSYVHNDFKFANILLFKEDRACLADFGNSHRLGDSVSSYAIGGAFPSPEAITARIAPKSSDGYTKLDSFSFGVELYHLLYHKILHAGTRIQKSRDPNGSLVYCRYVADHMNGYLEPTTVYDPVQKTTVQQPANPVMGFLAEAEEDCKRLEKLFWKPEDRFVFDLGTLTRACLSADPENRPSMQTIALRLQTIWDSLGK